MLGWLVHPIPAVFLLRRSDTTVPATHVSMAMQQDPIHEGGTHHICLAYIYIIYNFREYPHNIWSKNMVLRKQRTPPCIGSL